MTMNTEATQTVAASLRTASDGNAKDTEASYPDSNYPGIGNRASLDISNKS